MNIFYRSGPRAPDPYKYKKSNKTIIFRTCARRPPAAALLDILAVSSSLPHITGSGVNRILPTENLRTKSWFCTRTYGVPHIVFRLIELLDCKLTKILKIGKQCETHGSRMAKKTCVKKRIQCWALIIILYILPYQTFIVFLFILFCC